MSALRIIVLAGVGLALLAGPRAVDAQPAEKVVRVGWLHPRPLPAEWMAGFRQGLREFGYVEGKNLVVEYRWGDGRFDRLPVMAAELVRLNVDVLLGGNSAALLSLRDATRTIPIVMTAANDPVGLGLVASLAHPGGNVTGLSGVGPDLTGKRLELLRDVVPQLTRVTALSNPDNPSMALVLSGTHTAAKALGLGLQVLDVRRPSDLDQAFAAIVRGRSGALILPAETMLHSERARIAEFAVKHRIPTIGAWREFAEAGGLMVYGVSVPDVFRRAVGYIDKIVKGAKPADLPVEEPIKLELVLNLQTAKKLGLTVPPSVLLRADEVIGQ
jgi:putative ABC transport system substrate-binding protein